ncbi:DUF6065 family protein [Sphingosinicella sp. YJ22]|uniref:DUF6065 family protein n=1 Tax=Sphingosinicella sp. YJ22 TaxID=1104780 RepID=UPI00140CA48E|nr:DUF6065 family protein [Sphingosinicella sp. YJ22]
MTRESMDLVCYKYDGWGPRIRPASAKRQWMEETNERYAYRCLPLSIANAHGWEILSPVGFEARWAGGADMESVEIRMDPGHEDHLKPVSLFGYGTLTFHIEGIFRTPPGWNLWVSGSPNSQKDGIQALGGVIETDWSPYTFTMNWRFTRPAHWVRFEENEPIAFIFPVERGRVEQFEPRIAPLDSDLELKRQFETWSKSREAFQKWVVETNPAAPSDKWQKLYYRGLDAEGREGAADHQAKLRVKPFRNADGSIMAPGEARACPVRHGASGPPPARNVLLADQPGMAGLDPGANPALTLALNRIGFDARPQQQPLFETPAPRAEDTDTLALKQRDWIMQAAMRQRQLSPRTAGVPRVAGLSGEDFLDHFYALSRPVVIEGAVPPGTSDPAASLAAYLANGEGAVEREEVGSFTPLHFAPVNRLIAQLEGAKRVILAPPSETGRLDHRRGFASEMVDVTDDARLAAFPAARDSMTFEVDLETGDLLFVPRGWWHQATALDSGAAVAFTGFHWPNEGQADFPQH